MQQILTHKEVDKKIKYLHNKLLNNKSIPTDIYLVPNNYYNELNNNNYSQEIIQKVTNHIIDFLGIPSNIEVTIGIETSNNMLLEYSKLETVDQVGVYKVIGRYNKKIQITKKLNFEFIHILAILMHEITHDYLYYNNIMLDNELENEILTDLASVYLGFGYFLRNGYTPIYYTDDSNIKRYIKIGYVNPLSIKYAIKKSALIRKSKPIASLLPLWDRLKINYQIMKSNRELKNKKKLLNKKIERTLNQYNSVSDKLKKLSNTDNNISKHDGKILIDIASSLTREDLYRKIQSIQNKYENLKKKNNITISQINVLIKSITDIKSTVSKWEKLIDKYL